MSKTNFNVLSALNAYCKQLGILNVKLEDFLKQHQAFAINLVESFEARFNPTSNKLVHSGKAEVLEGEYKNFGLILEEFIKKVIVRTNYFLNKPYLSLKFDLSLFDEKLAKLPHPLTFREIFVFSEDFEAIHLRNGRVARGGLRWSDRKDDFRSEILGLVKTQTTKNTIIVPVGSKGGFYVKKSVAGLSKEEALNTGKECYKQFLSGCLDITDNVVEGMVIHPQNVVVYDGEDPYFAVAADKGTASFSDIANSISKEYGFWMGDAFASGGSNGYDHKKMAITSKGAWICVARHFREIGVDVSKQEFSVVGIGDMSGDVFGNGLLRSKKAKLICAFNHMHIFMDPTPNPETSYKERERLFNLPTSTWENYDLTTASKGAKLFKRSDKTCKLTPEIREVFNITAEELTPEELIKHVLKGEYDLLWNGGIGTYVKASHEANEDAGDKANDVLRINGFELGAKVVGEGGNLGLTQKGRVEYALNGGRINTDAIDNSAGVDCSDHEVNIKILLNALVASGKMSLEERNQMIKRMTQNVEELVLADNYLQSLALSLEQLKEDGEKVYIQFISELEAKGRLNRESEKVLKNDEICERYANEKKLTRPELAILLAYSKMETYDALLHSDLMKDKYCKKFLINYFPLEMREKLLPQIKEHKLSNEIACTVITNRFVNFAGITFGFELAKLAKKNLVQVAKAYLVAENILNLEKVFEDVKLLDHKAKAEVQYQTLFTIREKILKPVVLKILSEREITDIEEDAKHFASLMKTMKLEKDDLTLVNI